MRGQYSKLLKVLNKVLKVLTFALGCRRLSTFTLSKNHGGHVGEYPGTQKYSRSQAVILRGRHWFRVKHSHSMVVESVPSPILSPVTGCVSKKRWPGSQFKVTG